MRSKRRWIIAAGAAALLLGVGVGVWQSQTESSYARREAAQRFKKFCAARVQYRRVSQLPPGMQLPQGFASYFQDDNALLRSPDADALRAMGTNAALYLGREIRQGDSLWWHGYTRVFTNLPSGLRSMAPKPPASRWEIRQLAGLALGALGSNAAPAVPAVIEALRDSPRTFWFIWAEHLKRLPFQETDIDPLLAVLTRRGDTAEAVDVICTLHLHTASAARILASSLSLPDRPAKLRALGELGVMNESARLVLPGLIRATQEKGDQQVRAGAASVLERYGPAAAEAVPALIELLRDNDDELRYRAARALEAIGTQALAAAPALMQATNDSSVMVQRVAKRTLDSFGQ